MGRDAHRLHINLGFVAQETVLFLASVHGLCISLRDLKRILMPCLQFGIFTAVKEFTYLGKFLVNVNIN